ncbi:MAG: hypothetical protein N2712_00570 [Brevinematales bacterium]|nr:hypothetical protein [Brevinematales bacterium]
MKRLYFIVIIYFVFSFDLRGQVSFSTFDPLRCWTKIQTIYFDIYFSETSKGTAQRLSTIVDKIYEEVSEKMNVRFGYRFPIVVVDQSDLPNGYYVAIPSPFIVIYTSKITKLDNFVFDDDLKGIFIHELTHALAIEEANGVFWQFLRFIFSYYIVPNMYLPGVFIESPTVLNESIWGYGRLNNPIFTDSLYSQSYYGKFRNFYKANLVNEYPLDGWYLYGGMFFRYLVEKYSYEKTLSFYKENSYYLPNSFYLSFFNTFKNNLFSEWDEFGRYLSNKVVSRIYTSEVQQLSFEGGYKERLRKFDDFILYFQRGVKGELPSLKYVRVDGKEIGFLAYGRYLSRFDVKGSRIAFLETISSKYYTRNFLKLARIIKKSIPVLVDEISTDIQGVYDVSVVDDNTVVVLVQDDDTARVVKINLEVDNDKINFKTNILFEGQDIFYKKVSTYDNLLALVVSEDGLDVIKVFNFDTLELVYELRKFKFVSDITVTSNGILFSGLNGDKIDVFEIRDGKIFRVVSHLFSFFNVVSDGIRIYGLSFSREGVDIFFADKESFSLVAEVKKNSFDLYPKLRDIVSFKTNITSIQNYSYFNNITLFSIITSFFPDVHFNPDFSFRKVGLYFGFYDEPLEFRSYFISIAWNLNSRTVDYDVRFVDSSIPYTLFSFRVFRDHLDTNFTMVSGLRSRGYLFDTFTLDYYRLKVQGEFGNTYLKVYPFVAFSFPSFVGREVVDIVFPDYRFDDTSEGIVSPYFTFGITVNTLRSSLGAVTSEEGFLCNFNLKLANKIFGSEENSLVASAFFSYSFRIFGNNVLKLGLGLRGNLFSSYSNAFCYGGYLFKELFPVEEGDVYNINLPTYVGFREDGDYFFTSLAKVYLKLFEVNEGIWPIYITEFWVEVGGRGGILFQNFGDIVNRYLRTELTVGIFFNLNFIGYLDTRTGIEMIYNTLVKDYVVEFVFDFVLPF